MGIEGTIDVPDQFNYWKGRELYGDIYACATASCCKQRADVVRPKLQTSEVPPRSDTTAQARVTASLKHKRPKVKEDKDKADSADEAEDEDDRIPVVKTYKSERSLHGRHIRSHENRCQKVSSRHASSLCQRSHGLFQTTSVLA